MVDQKPARLRGAGSGGEEVVLAALAFVCLAVAQAAQGPWVPAKYVAGGVPPLPRLAIGGGQVVLELAVDDAGSVTAVKPLRTTPPFAAALAAEGKGWLFSPAEEERADPARPGATARVAVASKVALIGMFRPPVLRGPTLGALPKDVAGPAEDVAFPLTMVMPRFPPTARAGGQVLVEARIAPDGAIGDVKILQAQPPFESAALDALSQWTFKPARRAGVAVPSMVYIVFGFAQIVGNK
jgi:TonB family protein